MMSESYSSDNKEIENLRRVLNGVTSELVQLESKVKRRREEEEDSKKTSISKGLESRE